MFTSLNMTVEEVILRRGDKDLQTWSSHYQSYRSGCHILPLVVLINRVFQPSLLSRNVPIFTHPSPGSHPSVVMFMF